VWNRLYHFAEQGTLLFSRINGTTGDQVKFDNN